MSGLVVLDTVIRYLDFISKFEIGSIDSILPFVVLKYQIKIASRSRFMLQLCMLRLKKPEAQKSAKRPGARVTGFEAKARAFQKLSALSL